jgi:hypothetical protein
VLPAAHLPVLPHTGPVVQRASVAPTVIAAQVPLAAPVLAFEQAVQVPAQAVLPQKPSTQALDAHSLPAAQTAPLALHTPLAQPTQTPPVHCAPLAQFAAVVQVVPQATALPQMKGAQLVVTTAGQTPAPLQLAAAVSTPLAQLAARHDVVLGACWQVAPAAHRPVLPQTDPVVQRASATPTVVDAQVPLAAPVFAFAQAVQEPVQAVLQQNPSTHEPDTH